MKDYGTGPGGNAGGLQRWIEDGIPPGSFLTAVLENDLKHACEQADIENRYLLFDIVSWLYNESPGGCWGSPEQVEAWRAAGGLAGIEAKAKAAEEGKP